MLFFSGIRLVSQNLRYFAGARIRSLVFDLEHSLPSRRITLGFYFGTIAQSATSLTYIIVNMIFCGLISAPRSVLIVLWANLGIALLVFFAAIHSYVLIAFFWGALTFLYFKERHNKPSLAPAMMTLLGCVLLFMGTWVLEEEFTVLKILDFKHLSLANYGLSLIAFCAFAFTFRSTVIVTLFLIFMVQAIETEMTYALPFLFAGWVGIALGIIWSSRNETGCIRQLALIQATHRGFSALILMAVLCIEWTSSEGIVSQYLERITLIKTFQIALTSAFMACLSSLVLSPLSHKLYSYFKKRYPDNKEVPGSLCKYLHRHALCEPNTAMHLIHLEQVNVLKQMVAYCEYVASNRPDERVPRRIFEDNQARCDAIECFLTKAIDSVPMKTILAVSLNLQNRIQILKNLDELFFEIALKKTVSISASSLIEFRNNLNEGLQTILITLIDAVEKGDEMDLNFIEKMTLNKSGLSEMVHKKILTNHPDVTQSDQEILFSLTGRFERISWLLGQTGKLFQRRPFVSPRTKETPPHYRPQPAL